MIWKIQNWLAKNWGWYTYDGLRGFHPRHWPEGHVLYEDGCYTEKMALGNAWAYANMFKGTVVQELSDER